MFNSIVLIVITLLNTACLFGQIRELSAEDWKLGIGKQFFGHTITRLEGENDFTRVTNIAFHTLSDLKAETKQRAEAEMWTADSVKQMNRMYDLTSPGGELIVCIERLSIEAANGKFFSCIIQDTLGHELARKKLPEKIPESPVTDGYRWWEFGILHFAKPLGNHLFIYIIDGFESKRYKFLYTQ